MIHPIDQFIYDTLLFTKEEKSLFNRFQQSGIQKYNSYFCAKEIHYENVKTTYR